MRLPLLLVAAALAATACSDSQSPVAPRLAAASTASARASADNTGAGEYQIVDVGVAVGATLARVDINPGMLNSAGTLIARRPGGQFGWSEAGGFLNIVAPDGLILQPDATDDRGDLVGLTGPGDGQAFWYRPAGGSFQRVPVPDDAGLFYDQRMNQNGEVAGGYLANDGTCVLFEYSPAIGRMDVYTSDVDRLLIPAGFNDARLMVGEDVHLGTGQVFAFSWSAADGFSEETEPSGYLDVNDAGVRLFGENHAYSLVYPDGHRVLLPTPFGDPRVAGTNINDDGFVVGSAFDPARGAYVPLVWSPDLSGVVELPGLTASAIGWGQSINMYGDAAGTSLAPDGSYHVVFWKHAATIAGLAAATARYVSKPGVATALDAKLDEAAAAMQDGNEQAKASALNAYRNQVSAQSGKSISVVDANLLIRLSERF